MSDISLLNLKSVFAGDVNSMYKLTTEEEKTLSELKAEILKDDGKEALDKFVKDEESDIRKGVIFGFEGETYCEDDCGWDGLSHRCNCGNRRVYWTYDYGMFYGVAD